MQSIRISTKNLAQALELLASKNLSCEIGKKILAENEKRRQCVIPNTISLNLAKALLFVLPENKRENSPEENFLDYIKACATADKSNDFLFTSMADLLTNPAFQSLFKKSTSPDSLGYLYVPREFGAYIPLRLTQVVLQDNLISDRRVNHASVTLKYSAALYDGSTVAQQVVKFRTHELEAYFRSLGMLAEDLPDAEGNDFTYKYSKKTFPATKEYEEETYVLDVTSSKPVSFRGFLTHLTGFLPGNSVLKEVADKQRRIFLKVIKDFAVQYRVRGMATELTSYGLGRGDSMLYDGEYGRVVIDSIPKAALEFMDGFKDESQEEDDNRNQSRYQQRRRPAWSYSYDCEQDTFPVGATPDKMRRALEQVSPEEYTGVKNSFSISIITPDKTSRYGGFKSSTAHEEACLLPVLPLVKVFNLKTGTSNLVHIRNLQKYEYRKDSIDKLIIPSGAKRVVAALAQQATKATAADIIEGKGAATIIAAMGSPGLGKTSLAEVASEQCERPLYRLEATDLGTNPEQIEEALTEAFKLAARFDAMLLLDECNAYVHVRRGTDHKQQEIVAVFLRKLEYFRGLLMLTTNMTAAMGGEAYADFDIDPAILSRCSAVITFELPTIKQAFSIWKVQAEQLGVIQYISDEEFKLLAKTYNLSGRSIRNLLRLAISLCEYDKNENFKSEYIADAYEYSSRASSSLEGLRVDPSN